MRFIPETEAQALRPHLDKKFEGPVEVGTLLEDLAAMSRGTTVELIGAQAEAALVEALLKAAA